MADTTTQTTTQVPEWKTKADHLKQAIANDPSLGKQVVYRSKDRIDADPCVVPEISDKELTTNEYPDVVTEPPADMVSPKYSWSYPMGWYENSAADQGTRIAALEKETTDMKKNLETAQETVTDLKQTTVDSTNSTDEKLENLTKLMTMQASQVGKISAMLSAQTKPADTNAQQSTTDQGGNQ